jgi:hypothetical protein
MGADSAAAANIGDNNDLTQPQQQTDPAAAANNW